MIEVKDPRIEKNEREIKKLRDMLLNLLNRIERLEENERGRSGLLDEIRKHREISEILNKKIDQIYRKIM